MKKTQFILAVTLLASGISFAGTCDKVVVSDCGPWYVSVYGGGSFFDDAETVLGDIGLDSGWMIGGAFGLRTDKGWRFELELSHSQNPIDAFLGFDDWNTTDAVPAAFFKNPGRGEIERTAMMVNAAKEFTALQFLGITPYLGAGIGLSNIEVDGGFVDEIALAYQFMGGLGYDLTECLQIFAEYRLMGQSDLEDAQGWYDTTEVDLGWSQAVLMGVRWMF